MGDQFCLKWNNHQNTLISVFDALLGTESLVDCTLVAGGQFLKGHKVVLSACSPLLETLLGQHSEKHPILILKDIKFHELRAMMDYMYRGEVNISQDQLDSFLRAAESLQIKGLTDQGGGGESKGGGSSGSSKPVESVASPPSKRRRRASPEPEEESNTSDITNDSKPYVPSHITPHIATPVPLQTTIHPPSSTPQPPPPDRLKTEPPDIVTPKQEYIEAQQSDVEDLTLDDEDDYTMDMSAAVQQQPGTSQGPNTPQSFSNWQAQALDRTNDEVFMAAQNAINNQNNAQAWPVKVEMNPGDGLPFSLGLEGAPVPVETPSGESRFVCQTCHRSYKHLFHLKAHLKECSSEPLFECEKCQRKFYHSRNLARHMQNIHKEPKKSQEHAAQASTAPIKEEPVATQEVASGPDLLATTTPEIIVVAPEVSHQNSSQQNSVALTAKGHTDTHRASLCTDESSVERSQPSPVPTAHEGSTNVGTLSGTFTQSTLRPRSSGRLANSGERVYWQRSKRGRKRGAFTRNQESPKRDSSDISESNSVTKNGPQIMSSFTLTEKESKGVSENTSLEYLCKKFNIQPCSVYLEKCAIPLPAEEKLEEEDIKDGGAISPENIKKEVENVENPICNQEAILSPTTNSDSDTTPSIRIRPRADLFYTSDEYFPRRRGRSSKCAMVQQKEQLERERLRDLKHKELREKELRERAEVLRHLEKL